MRHGKRVRHPGGCAKSETANTWEGSMRNTTRWFNFASGVGLLLALFTTNGFAANPHCTDLGGVILTNVGGFGQIDGSPTTMGVATGDLKGAIGIQIVTASPDFTSIT